MYTWFKIGDGVNVALSGQHTKSGKPMILNSIDGQTWNPSAYYLCSMHWIENDKKQMLKGATVPGSYYFISGENNHIAWGSSKLNSHFSDLFLEDFNNGSTVDTEM